jgi:two-component system alkaline phosphatase synthesis response regulator PhoP
MYRKVVLVVDDEPDMLNLLDLTIKDNGYVAFKARNAEIALGLIRSFLPNLIVLDVLMPGMDGFELCERIREIPYMADVPIIFFTALDSVHSRQQAVQVGGNAVVTKENFPCGLVSKIKTYLNNNQPNPNH